MRELKNHADKAILALTGNKCDLNETREVSTKGNSKIIIDSML